MQKRYTCLLQNHFMHPRKYQTLQHVCDDATLRRDAGGLAPLPAAAGTHSITPAAKPRLPANSRGRAKLVQNTMHAPAVVASPAAITRANATPTLPSATMAAAEAVLRVRTCYLGAPESQRRSEQRAARGAGTRTGEGAPAVVAGQ